METYLGERGMPLHNERFGELSDQLIKKVYILQHILQKLPTMWAHARPVDGHILPDFPDDPCQWIDFEPCRITSREHGRHGDLFNGVCNRKANPIIANIQVDFPEGDTVSGLVASQHRWKGHIWGLSMYRRGLKWWYLRLVMFGRRGEMGRSGRCRSCEYILRLYMHITEYSIAPYRGMIRKKMATHSNVYTMIPS